MAVVTEHIELATRGDAEVIDVTEQIRRAIATCGLQDGIACVFAPGSTGGITTLEYESGCIMDLQRAFEQLAPRTIPYEHHRRWGDGNGHSHVRAALLGASLSIPFVDGEPVLGTWQQVVFVDFDNRARSRRLVLQLVGQ